MRRNAGENVESEVPKVPLDPLDEQVMYAKILIHIQSIVSIYDGSSK